MADELNFITTDAATIYATVMNALMDGVNEALYPGDERRIFGEALAAVLIAMSNEYNDKAKQRMLQHARGKELDAIGARYGVERAEPAHAYATFRFSVTAAQPGNIIIPKGTKITTDGSIYFETEHLAVLQAGSFYVDIRGVCAEGGEDYNGFTAGSIATLVDLIPYVTAVNITASTGGDNGEPYPDEDGGTGDDKYRERIRLSPATQSTAGSENAYKYFALSADPNIIDVAVDVPDANIVNIYPLMVDGGIPDAETLAAVEAALSDDVRPMTDKVTALAPTQVEYSIEIEYYCTRDKEAATVQTVEAVGGALDQFIAWQRAQLGRDINPDKLRSFILAPNWAEGLTGADRVVITSPTFAEIGKNQVAKLTGTPVVTHRLV